MDALRALLLGCLTTALLAPVAAADGPADVCVKDGQIVTGPECSPPASADSDPQPGPLDVCVKDGEVVVGPECQA